MKTLSKDQLGVGSTSFFLTDSFIYSFLLRSGSFRSFYASLFSTFSTIPAFGTWFGIRPTMTL